VLTCVGHGRARHALGGVPDCVPPSPCLSPKCAGLCSLLKANRARNLRRNAGAQTTAWARCRLALECYVCCVKICAVQARMYRGLVEPAGSSSEIHGRARRAKPCTGMKARLLTDRLCLCCLLVNDAFILTERTNACRKRCTKGQRVSLQQL